MGKIGGLCLIAALALTGCAAPASGAGETPSPTTPTATRVEVDPRTVADDAKLKAFIADIQKSGTEYATLPPADIAGMAPELCQHYDGGFTTEDLRKSAGEKLAAAGEAAKLDVCPPR
jgi:hypothetical protein